VTNINFHTCHCFVIFTAYAGGASILMLTGTENDSYG